MPAVNYGNPVFWRPTNAVGMAATVDGDMDGQAFKINLYWSGVLLATSERSREQLRDEVSIFLQSYIPRDIPEELAVHFENDGDTFRKIVDPSWTAEA